MRATKWTALLAAFVLALAFGVAACGDSDEPEETTGGGNETTETTEGGGEGGAVSEWFVQEDFEQAMEWREAEPEGPEGEPWAQMLPPVEMVDTSEYAVDGAPNICFSNASVDNPWRQVGWKTMQATVEQYGNEIGNFRAVDAEAQDEKQISDIERLAGSGNCDVMIVSPNTTQTLTPAVEQACEEVPVVVFDRGVDTDCPVSFVQPIGGYGFGADGAEFLAENVDAGGKILALRILPGVDVLETRYAAMREVFDKETELELVGAEFTDGDPAKTKSIVSDYIQREGQLDGIWMDAGATAVAAIEAFEDNGMEIPPIVGEDQYDFLQRMQEDEVTGIAPTFPTYQWRTAIDAAVKIANGEEVPKKWTLPQPTLTEDNVGEYLQEGLPPLHYALCGCEDLPGYPDRWGG
jgi:ribose transport system substrate-binding protein